MIVAIGIAGQVWSQQNGSVQEESSVSRSWELGGYLKNLQTLIFFNDSYFVPGQATASDTSLQDNLVHHRLNFRWFINDRFTFRAEARTRLFFGDLVRATRHYASLIDDANNDYFDLSMVILNDKGFVLHTMLDRCYLEYASGPWEIGLGRQRINWGINTVWNPNDIFNAFNFTDFDYEERPGSDALRVRYYTGFASSIELATNAFDTWGEAVAAALWKFNRKQYDFQVLAGTAEGDATLGFGWAGNLKNAGFKGEATWFIPWQGKRPQSLNATLGIDYSFANAFYVSTGYLYNSNGSSGEGNIFGFTLSARNLYPYRHALFASAAYPFNPLLQGSFAVIYSPVRSHAVFLNPSLAYSLSENWGLDLVGQMALSRADKRYTAPIQAVFFRIKWSY